LIREYVNAFRGVECVFWSKNKDKSITLEIINSVIETSHEITDKLYADIVAKFSEFVLSPKELLERNFFLTSVATALFNDSFGVNDEKLKKALRILSERLNEDAFMQVCEYLKYISKLSLMAENSRDKMSEYLSYWLFMNIRDSEEFIVEEMPLYMFAGSVIYNVFNNFLDKNNLELK
jgi:hypothetical protein